MFTLDAPPGFQGLQGDLPVEIYERHMPHWRQAGATYFVTFRLKDSLPKARLEELRQFAGESDRAGKDKGKRARQVLQKIDDCLDEGLGNCLLSDGQLVELVGEALRFFEGERYELGAYVVMPNHVHLVMRPFEGNPLETILQSRKRACALAVNEVLGRTGSLWQEESYDTIVRDAEHLYRVVQYIGKNPAKAGLVEGEALRWVSPVWQAAGWGFEA